MNEDNKGWIKLYRSIWENTIWKSKDKFDDRSAWIDLLLMANHEQKQAVYKKQAIDIHRGQVFTSIPHLSKRWGWSENRVRRYLLLLCNLGMIYRDGTPNGTLVTIVNYGFYQDDRRTNGRGDGSANGSANGRADGSQTRREEDKEEKKVEGPPLPSLGGRVYE